MPAATYERWPTRFNTMVCAFSFRRIDEKNIKDDALESRRDNSFAGGHHCVRAGHLRANDRARSRVRIKALRRRITSNSAWPGPGSPAERLPDGMTPTPPDIRLASAFFLHPTTLGDTEHWVQPMDHEETRRGTDRGTVSIQASVFNDCCRVYAPRYRQSIVSEYHGEDLVSQIQTIGYQDTRAAFYHFLAEIGPEEPIIMASHSQGTFHLVRLIEEEVDGTPLMKRLVAAYAIGNSLPQALVDDSYEDIEVCRGRHVSLPGMPRSGQAPISLRGAGHMEPSGFDPGPRICVNPVTWRTDGTRSDKGDHLGALTLEAGYSDLDTSLGELVSNTVSAYCGDESTRKWLFVNGDRDEKLKLQGFWSLFMRNLHGLDYSLFWGNIRENATTRAQAFSEAQ